MVTGVEPVMTTNTASTAPLVTHTKDASVKSDRRSNKPIMEKRRRARINNCLNELKTLILDYSKKDPARHSKLEKADILEKTVKHLQELQRQQAVMQQAADPKVLNKFHAGFTDCANEVNRFPGIDPSVKRRLMQHLNSCLNGVKADIPSMSHNQQRTVASIPMHAQLLPSPPSSPEQDHFHNSHYQPQHLSNSSQSYIMNSHIQQTPNGFFLPNGLQVYPTKLSNGSVALLLPQNLQKSQQLHTSQTTVSNMMTSSSLQGSLIMQVPSRTASTGSASSNSSSNYENNISPATCFLNYSPQSPNQFSEPMECKPSPIQRSSSHHIEVIQSNIQQPLSLVVKKNIKEEDQPWRPW